MGCILSRSPEACNMIDSGIVTECQDCTGYIRNESEEEIDTNCVAQSSRDKCQVVKPCEECMFNAPVKTLTKLEVPPVTGTVYAVDARVLTGLMAVCGHAGNEVSPDNVRKCKGYSDHSFKKGTCTHYRKELEGGCDWTGAI